MINMFVLYREESNGKRDLCVAIDKDSIYVICAVVPLEGRKHIINNHSISI